MIDSGINKLREMSDQLALRDQNRSRLVIHNKLVTFLKAIPGHQLSQHHEFCNSLAQLTAQQRRDAVVERYGPLCLQKCEHLLYQLDSLSPE